MNKNNTVQSSAAAVAVVATEMWRLHRMATSDVTRRSAPLIQQLISQATAAAEASEAHVTG